MQPKVDEKLVTLIEQMTAEAGISFSREQAELCSRHIELVLQWNRRVNLTRITDPNEILSKHLLDSLLPAVWLPGEGPALDVGTGAGFPGVPLRILKGGLEMVLLEQNRKKASFLKQLCATLGLPGLDVLHESWERLSGSAEHAERYSLIVMRAVRLEESHLSLLASRLLEPGGVFAFWAGPKAEKELETLENSVSEMEFIGGRSYGLPGIPAPRFLYRWCKNSGEISGGENGKP